MNEAKDVEHSPWAVFLIFLRLGLSSFGGPVAHLGYFHAEFVARRRWLGERAYADLVALCQFLPGPASSQVGMALGLQRAGYRGALAAWAGFTLPSAIVLILFALGLARHGDALPPGVLHGLKVVAVAVVAQAVWGMAGKLCTDRARIGLMTLAACVVLALPTAWSQVGVIALAGLAGMVLFRAQVEAGVREPSAATRRAASSGARAGGLGPLPSASVPLAGVSEPDSGVLTGAPGPRSGWLWLAAFFALLAALPLLAALQPDGWLARVDAFYRSGALVFGGGHVVLPLLQAEVVPTGWVDNEAFLAGYGAAQAVPGPLFTFAAFLGAVRSVPPAGVTGALLATAAIFLPGLLLVAAALPWWERLRRWRLVRHAVRGANAAVVGILTAALIAPIGTDLVANPLAAGLAVLALASLLLLRPPVVPLVASCAAVGWLLL